MGRRQRGRDRPVDRPPQRPQDMHSSLPARPPPPRDNYRDDRNDYGRNDYYSRGNDQYGDSRSRGDYNNYPPPPGLDSYRPPQGDFTFRADKPAGVQNLSGDSYRPQDNRSQDNRRGGSWRDNPDARYGGRGGRGQQSRGRDRKPFGRFRPFVPAERELLSTSHDTGNERALYNTESGVTYRPLDELTDSGEAEMDISGDENDDSIEPAHKRTRLSRNQAGGDSAPKWSNPDPYTALPAEGSAPGKKRDVVQLIRKARVQVEPVKASLPTELEEFISCDFDSSDEGDGNQDGDRIIGAASSVHESPRGAPAIPTGPRQSNRGGDVQDATVLQRAPPPPTEPPPPPPPSKRKIPTREIAVARHYAALGSRKRTHDDYIIPQHQVKGGPTPPLRDSEILPEWRGDQTPWLVTDHSDNSRPGVWLHKEIVDFYEFVRPRPPDELARTQLIDDLKEFCQCLWPDAEVFAFGSFPTGLYLPTSDMDVVVVSDQVLKGTGPPKYVGRSSIQEFGLNLRKSGRIQNNWNIEYIFFARVPLVKYVDSRACLKVDVSFENMGGVQAVQTFNAWKEQYPVMPILVTLIKHLLAMRGLNEPVNGGIGGFSVICLVVSMLQMMPQVQSRNMDPLHHLGDLFMHFLDLYGSQFDYKTTAICLNPPKYIPKHQVKQFTYKSPNRFSIIDPNNPQNDVSGGSALTPQIVQLFAHSFRVIQEQLASASENPEKSKGLLIPLFQGNYDSFKVQRAHLERLAEGYEPPAPPPLKQRKGDTDHPKGGPNRGSNRGRGGYSRNRGGSRASKR